MSDLICGAYAEAYGSQPSATRQKALEARFGVRGKALSLRKAGKIDGITGEAMRLIEAKVAPLLREASVPELETAARLLVAASPIPASIGSVLFEAGLSDVKMSADQFLSLLELVNLDIEAVTGTSLVYEDGWLLDARDAGVTGALKIAAKHTSAFGMTTAANVRQALAAEDAASELDDVLNVLRNSEKVKWAGEWLWVEKDNDNIHSNSLVNVMRRMLSVNSPLTAESAHEGIERVYKFRKRQTVPTVEAILGFAENSKFFAVEGNLISSVEPLDYHETLGTVAASIVDLIKASPFGVLDRTSLTEACEDAGISRGTLGVWTSYSEFMQRYGQNVWGVRGTDISPSTIKEIQKTARARKAEEPRRREWSWSTRSRIVLTMDVDSTSYTSGVWSVDSTLRRKLAGRRFVALVAGEQVGQIATSDTNNWIWGWAPAMRALGICRGDVLQAVLDLSEGTANISAVKSDLAAICSSTKPESSPPCSDELGYRLIPVEINVAEAFKTSLEPVDIERLRREAKLQDAYKTKLESLGHSVHSVEVRVDGQLLRVDLYDSDTEELIEVKSDTDRMTIRLALGQVLDYARIIRPKRRQILVPQAPTASLIALLHEYDVDVIWPAANGNFELSLAC